MLKNSNNLNKKIILSISVLLLTIGGLSISDSFGQTNEIPELLSDVPVPETAQIPELLSGTQALDSQIPVANNNLIRESKQVYANTSVFDQDTFTITTFDESITITKDSSEVKSDYTTWWGTTNDGYNANFLIFDDGTIQASIQTAETKYNIGSTGIDTIHTLEDIDVSQLPPDHPENFVFDFPHLPQPIQDDIELFANSHVGGRDYTENTVTITLVVGYTTEADDKNTRIDRIIRGAVEDANRSYRINGLPIELVLVDTGEARGYVEELNDSRTFGIEHDLNNLLDNNNANNANNLNRLRADAANQNADVVILVTHYDEVTNPNPCGVAPISPHNVEQSVAVVKDSCLASNLSLPHEIGHLLGARHNPEEDSNNTPFTYQHGHYSVPARERTIMSYDCPGGCIRLGQWSDPNETYGNRGQVVAGSENTHFNAKVLYGSAQHIASLRGDVQRYDIVSPTGAFEWLGQQASRIFNQGDSMDISVTFDEPIHEDHPPTVTVSDGTLSTPIVMNRNSETAFSASHTLTTEEGTVTLQFSNAQDLFTNPVIQIATGNSGTVTVNSPDTEKPVITLTGITPPLELRVDTYTELGATVTDNDPAYSENVVIGGDTVDTTTVGVYHVTYNAPADVAQNIPDQVTRVVTVQDTTVPVITLNPPNPQSITQNDTYNELDAVCKDNTVDISSSIVIDASSVDTTTVGTYKVTYDCQDAIGLDAIQVIRTVNVVLAQVPPVLASINDVNVNEGANLDVPVSATDANSDAIILTIENTNTLPNWISISDNGDGSGNVEIRAITEVPLTNYNVIVKATANNDSVTQSFIINIDEVNQLPTLNTDAIPDIFEVGVPYSFFVTATDADRPAQTLTYSLGGTPPVNATYNSTTGEFNWTPGATQVGIHNFSYQVIDSMDGALAFMSIANVVATSPINDVDVGFDLASKNITIAWDFGSNPDRENCISKSEIYIYSDNNGVVDHTLYHFFGTSSTLTEGYVVGATAAENVDSIIPCKGSTTFNVSDFNVPFVHSDFDVFMSFYHTTDSISPYTLNGNLIPLNEGTMLYSDNYQIEPIHCTQQGWDTFPKTTNYVHDLEKIVVTYITTDICDDPEKKVITISFEDLLADETIKFSQQLSFDTHIINVIGMPTDTTAPIITLTGANPQIIGLGNGYTELGATTDDGSPVTIDNTAFVDAIGSYSITYDSIDASDNTAIQVIRTVNVVNINTAPTNLTAIAANSQVTLGWIAPADLLLQPVQLTTTDVPIVQLAFATTGELYEMRHESETPPNAITDYLVEYSSDGGISWNIFADGVSTQTSAIVLNLTNGQSYDFRISAINAFGTGYPSTTVTATPSATGQWTSFANTIYTPPEPDTIVHF